MAYTKQNFENGKVLTAEQLNRMDAGILEASQTAEALMQAKESGELNGKDGYTPVKGVDYFDGIPGKDGEDGYTPTKGKDYFDGLPGKTAYEYAKDGGYTGSEAEFAEKLAQEYPTKVSELTNDAGYLTGYTESDPTVPAWAKAASKPTYTAAEVGAVSPEELEKAKLLIVPILQDETNPGNFYTTVPYNDIIAALNEERMVCALVNNSLVAPVSSVRNQGVYFSTAYENVLYWFCINHDNSVSFRFIEAVDIEAVNALSTSKLDASALPQAINTALAQAKASGEFDGDPGKTAYEYAKDGGYTGTETEFGAKLAAEYPTKLSQFTNDPGYITGEDIPVQSVNGKTGAVQLGAADVGARPNTWTPSHSDVGADKAGTASAAVGTHNAKTDAHNDIRLLISALAARMDALANSDDETLDQMAEVVAYIKDNRGLIEQITTGKVSVSDIVNNLTTNVTNKPLSAAQGVALKALIDAIVIPTKLSQLTNDKGYLTGYTETDPTVPAWAKSASKPTYSKSEVGLGNVDNVRQYSASNPPPYPVTSVNGKTGAVSLGTLTITGVDTNGTTHTWTVYGG